MIKGGLIICCTGIKFIFIFILSSKLIFNIFLHMIASLFGSFFHKVLLTKLTFNEYFYFDCFCNQFSITCQLSAINPSKPSLIYTLNPVWVRNFEGKILDNSPCYLSEVLLILNLDKASSCFSLLCFCMSILLF